MNEGTALTILGRAIDEAFGEVWEDAEVERLHDRLTAGGYARLTSPEGPYLDLFVLGKAEPKGSYRPVPTAQGARVISSNKHEAAWSRAVRRAAKDAMGRTEIEPGPVIVRLAFTLSRANRRDRQGPEPIGSPDLDKLARSVLDALAGVAYADDGQVVELACSKRWAPDGAHESAEGVAISVLRRRGMPPMQERALLHRPEGSGPSD